jgi:hypothetical protein
MVNPAGWLSSRWPMFRWKVLFSCCSPDARGELMINVMYTDTTPFGLGQDI